jgi:sRNA-binding carbon storage regulator CsrA
MSLCITIKNDEAIRIGNNTIIRVGVYRSPGGAKSYRVAIDAPMDIEVRRISLTDAFKVIAEQTSNSVADSLKLLSKESLPSSARRLE